MLTISDKKARLIILALLGVLLTPSTSLAQDHLREVRERANSDDARTLQEAAFHAEARATVIRHLTRNRLNLGGNTFRVKRHPAGVGCFVYEPRTSFAGVVRQIVWWVNDDNTAFAMNSPSKTLTPALEFPPTGAIQPTHQVVAYVFSGEALPPLEDRRAVGTTDGFTVQEYHAYRAVVDAPMSVSEEQAHRRVGRCLGISAGDVAQAVRKVLRILYENGWMDRPVHEVRHASDWNDHAPSPNCD